MEGVFYDALDAPLCHHDEPGASGYESLKCNMTLNLHDPKPPVRGTLTSPDLHLLKLSSPELERLIIQSCSGLTPGTPINSPTRFLPPKHVTDEQEGFADGFIRALADLHCQQSVSGLTGAEVPPAAAGLPHSCTFNQDIQDTHQAWDGYTDASIGTRAQNSRPADYQSLKDEPQRVPETPPLSPIDMEDQERIKAERKRMRNRVAASKCRKRKLERLARLEERVSRLSGENGELRTAAQGLRDQVLQLRQELLDHIKSGCKQLSQQLHTVKDF